MTQERSGAAMQAEILAIGSEITNGSKLDTNSQWLSLQLAELGIPVIAHTSVADELPAMQTALRVAVARAAIVLITGGLGPTLDDLTREALAELAGVELVLHEPSLEHIRELFTRRNRPMPARNSVQAQFPQGATPLPNPRGTAPGIWMELPTDNATGVAFLAAMPGVPSEMKVMFAEQVAPRLPPGRQVILRRLIHSFGMGESQAEESLGDLTARNRDPEVGITAHEATITLRITAMGSTRAECDEKVASTRALIYQRLGNSIFGEGDDELEDVVVRLLNEQSRTLATVECGTGGRLAEWLTSVADHQSAYRGGLVLTDATRIPFLKGVEFAATQTDCDRAATWARTLRAELKTDFALAVTGWTELPGTTESSAAAIPISHVALASEQGVAVEEIRHLIDPSISRSRAAKTALNLLRLQLLGVSTPAH